MTAVNASRTLLADLAALVWPVACVGCGHPNRELCGECRNAIQVATPLSLEVASSPIPVYARGKYSGVLRRLLVGYKHEMRTGFARPLGEEFAHPLRAAMSHAVVPPLVISAPSRGASVRHRGFHHVDAVMRIALHGVPDPATAVRALRSTRGRRGQVGLEATDREINARRIAVRSGFHSRIQGREVILVDDIFTTGATMRAAHTVLEKAGARVIAAAVVASVSYGGTPGAL